MNSLICPNCGANLIEDASENLIQTEDGGFVMDAYPAYVCQNDCGYVKKIEHFPEIIAQQGEDRLLLLFPNEQGRILEVQDSIIGPPIHYLSILGRGGWEDYTGNHNVEELLKNVRDSRSAYLKQPNIFTYATSELSQDAFLRWLFEHIRLENNDVANKIAKHLLSEILEKFKMKNPEFTGEDFWPYSLEIKQQVHNIDLLLTFESKSSSEKICVIIEDKTNSGESRKNQPEYYADKLKLKNSHDVIIIPVILKTGYTSKEEQKNFADRNIVFIGYEDLFHIFSNYSSEISENVILNSWWNHFCELYYQPIKQAETYSINPHSTLGALNQLVKDQSYPEEIVFRKLNEYLFQGISEPFLTKTFSVQGKGHIDWHFEIHKQHWSSIEKNIAISVYFIWDTYNFSLVIKTSPFKYKPLKKLEAEDKDIYIAARELIKSEIKMIKQLDWKMTNYYLQIAQMNNIEKMAIGNLKEQIRSDIHLISNEIDQIMSK